MSVFASGAFLQQCFSVHPLTLKLKLVTPPSLVGIVCTNCRMKHRLTVRKVVFHVVEKEETQDVSMVSFQHCSETHPEDMRISSVDVVRDAVEFRCHPCRRTYLLEIGMIETHQ
jgi:hypothetical protein